MEGEVTAFIHYASLALPRLLNNDISDTVESQNNLFNTIQEILIKFKNLINRNSTECYSELFNAFRMLVDALIDTNIDLAGTIQRKLPETSEVERLNHSLLTKSQQLEKISAEFEASRRRESDLSGALASLKEESDRLKEEKRRLITSLATKFEIDRDMNSLSDISLISSVDDVLNSKESQIEELKSENNRYKNCISEITRNLGVIDEINGIEEAVVAKFDALNQEKAELSRKLMIQEQQHKAEVSRLLNEKDKSLSSLESDLAEATKEFKTKCDRLTQQNQELSRKLETSVKQDNRYQEEITKLVQKLSDLKDENKTMSQTIESLRESEKQYTQNVQKYKETIKSLNSTTSELESRIEVLKKQYKNVGEVLRQKDAELAEKTTLISDLSDKLNDIETSTKKMIEKQEAESQTKIKEIDNLHRQRYEKLWTKYDSYSKLSKKLAAENKRIESELQSIKEGHEKSISISEKRSSRLSEKLHSLKSLVKQMKLDEEAILQEKEQYKEALRACRLSNSELENNCKMLQSTVRTLEKDNEALEEELKSVMKAVKDLYSSYRTSGYFQSLRTLFEQASLPLGSYQQPRLYFEAFNIFNLKPEKLTSEKDSILIMNEINKAILALPMAKGLALIGFSSDSLQERLSALLRFLRDLKDILIQQEEAHNQLTALVASQHQAIIRMTQSPPASPSKFDPDEDSLSL